MKLKNRLDITFEEMTSKLERGEMQMHKFPLGFIVTQIVEIHRERILHVVLLSGEKLARWKDEALSCLKDFGRQYQCSAIEAHCRPGLAKMLKPLGFRTIKKIMRTEL